MKWTTETATAYTAHGKKLPKPLKYEYKWEAYENYDEVVRANDLLNNDDVVKARNVDRKLAARGKAQTEAFKLAGIVKPDEKNDPQVRLTNMFNTLMTATNDDGTPLYTKEQARALASQMVKVDWADTDDGE